MDVYFDCFSGISGDMVLGAFIDLGVPLNFLKRELERLSIGDFDIKVNKTAKEGIVGTNFLVKVPKRTNERNFSEIVSIIQRSNLSVNVKKRSIKIFNNIAQAESRIHKCDINHIHFHEIGGTDSIIDIVGVSICMEYFKIENVFSSEVPLGRGFVECLHGVIPTPSPATIEILKNVPVYGTNLNEELVTPTGAGILVSLAESFGEIPKMLVHKVGYGCGKRDLLNKPNLLRILLGKFKISNLNSYLCNEDELVSIIETNIDDMNPEIYSFLIEKFFALGVLDICYIPITMKKSRPGVKLEIISPENIRSEIVKELLLQTTTLGVRYYTAKRSALHRELVEIETELGKLDVKVSIRNDGSRQYFPEYDVCRKLALENNLPIRDVYSIINKVVAGS